MNIDALSSRSQVVIRGLAAKRGVPVETVIDRFYQIFRRRPVSRHYRGDGANPESGPDRYVPYFS